MGWTLVCVAIGDPHSPWPYLAAFVGLSGWAPYAVVFFCCLSKVKFKGKLKARLPIPFSQKYLKLSIKASLKDRPKRRDRRRD